MEQRRVGTPERISHQTTIEFGSVSYPFYVRSGTDASHELADLIVGLDTDRVVIITEAGVPQSIVEGLRKSLDAVVPSTVERFSATEQAKTLVTIGHLADRVLGSGVSRRSCLVAMGGGLTGNLTGLLAALLFRGLRFVHVPTTFLAMSDSVLSLKQAVNSGLGKNHLGTFYAPELVWNDLGHIATLPRDEDRSALCEMIKNVVAICPERHDEVQGILRVDAVYTDEAYLQFLEVCVQAKCSVMRDDPHERARALILEYGHTTGHAIEHLTGGGVRHGYAIGLGMLVAARISREMGLLDQNAEAAHRHLLECNGAPTALPVALDAADILRAIGHDNKRGYIASREGQCDMVLLEALGVPLAGAGGTLITQVPEALVRAGLRAVGA